ncbi:MAG: excinuclease ABC subunit UvrA, partial [Candidatus Omnitrophica bacterium]|nr:excinuclease ABC subunit UvrA [Candidatus Omnitrophota bacterium]
MMDIPSYITLENVKTHNLRSISLKVQHGTITVVTGLSGSGKSSLAIDTLYAEGQRRYIESLSPYTRQFLERMERPPVESIRGILPAICIEAKNVVTNARSTVGTQTEINDYLRLLFARVGTMYCEACGKEVKVDTVEMVCQDLVDHYNGSYAAVIFSIPVEKTTEDHIALYVQELNKQGYTRVFVNNTVIGIFSRDALNAGVCADGRIDVVLDRIKINAANTGRLIDSLASAYARGHDHLAVALFDDQKFVNAKCVRNYSAVFSCAECKKTFNKPEPNLFSFNSPIGACPECEGFGRVIVIDRDLIVPDVNKSIREGAIEPWEKPSAEWERSQLMAFCKKENIPINVPFRRLKKSDITKIFEGTGKGDYFSVNDFFDYLEKKKYKMHVRVFLSRYRNYVTCTRCNGARVRGEALNVKLAGRTIYDVQCMTIHDARVFFNELKFNPMQTAMTGPAMAELTSRLQYLDEVGLGYLTLDRMSRTLSGGEMQRINLATALGTQLVDTLYVLDEPSIGLHERDNEKLIKILQYLKKLGNTIVLIEHDSQIIGVADHVVDLGPGAGAQGGKIMYAGASDGLRAVKDSFTAKYLRGEETITLRDGKTPEEKNAEQVITITGAREHNLKDITVTIPLGRFVVVTGLSGAGKSTLVYDVLYKNFLKQKGRPVSDIGAVSEIKGFDMIDEVVFVDQSTLGRS